MDIDKDCSFQILQYIQNTTCHLIKTNNHDVSILEPLPIIIKNSKNSTLYDSEKVGLCEFSQFCINIINPVTEEDKRLKSILQGELEITQEDSKNLYFFQLYIGLL